MIGRVDFTMAGYPAVAVLGDDLRWLCVDHPEVATVLNQTLDMDLAEPTSPGNLYGASVLKSAKLLHGRATLEPKKPIPADAVY
jgi:hypothetical protein